MDSPSMSLGSDLKFRAYAALVAVGVVAVLAVLGYRTAPLGTAAALQPAPPTVLRWQQAPSPAVSGPTPTQHPRGDSPRSQDRLDAWLDTPPLPAGSAAFSPPDDVSHVSAMLDLPRVAALSLRCSFAEVAAGSRAAIFKSPQRQLPHMPPQWRFNPLVIFTPPVRRNYRSTPRTSTCLRDPYPSAYGATAAGGWHNVLFGVRKRPTPSSPRSAARSGVD
ncbi:hypothetical protein E2562_023732 [Oryza meyeriana var. granulata]|uniref:Uncharacterized protein n=1 Tax=Oryza meyeriana var. granulata TaxID=110450 RepID=A0A6G1DN39_9ORYZ|nr:hypothetical protein E2562_023732 [Oryza meyeriana var. granulata]